MIYILAASALLSLHYGLFFSNRPASTARVLIKTSTTALLTLWAFLAGAPWLIVLALAFSTLGDALLGASEEKFLLHGMAAFFVAHAAYIPIFWEHGAETRSFTLLAVQIALTVGAAFFVRSLMPWIDKPMRWPVLGYAIIILVMANAALRLDPALWLATLGALAFVTSDMILSLELFRLPKDAAIRRYTSRAVWFLYYGGQALIAWAFVSAAI